MSNELSIKDAQLPAFMTEEELSGSGMEDMTQHIIPPRIKVVQGSSKKPFSEKFVPGDVVLTPSLQKICGKEDYFVFTPVYAFTEYALVNPYAMAGTLPMIRERTLDSKTELAIKAKNMEKIPCPEKPDLLCEYKTMLNFLVCIYDSPLDFPSVMTFSGGEYKYGSSFLGLLMGKHKMYTRNFCAVVGEHSNPGNEWLGLDIMNPLADCGYGPFVQDEEWFKRCKEFYHQFTAERENIQVNHDDVKTEVDTGEFE